MQRSIFTLYVGGEFQKDGAPLDGKTVSQVLTHALERSARSWGGSTMLFGWGAFIDAGGAYVQEKSARIEIVTEGRYRFQIAAFAEDIRDRLNVESVLVTEVQNASAELVDGRPVYHPLSRALEVA